MSALLNRRAASIRPRGTTAHEATEAVYDYAVRQDVYPSRHDLHDCRRGILEGIRQALALRYLREEPEPDGTASLRITGRGYDLLRCSDEEGAVAL